MNTVAAQITEYEPLSRHTSWRIGGPARYYSPVSSAAELRQVIAWGRAHELPLFLLGGGTNLLARDSGFDGLVIRYTARDWCIDDQGDTARLHADAGAPMAGTARRVSAAGWAGLEWAEGLPGTIGGAAFGNAGCYGGDMANVLAQAVVLTDGAEQAWPAEHLDYAYRSSCLKAARNQPVVQGLPPVILTVTLRLERSDPAELAAVMARNAAARKQKTPWGRSCGSVFKNPPAGTSGAVLSAGQLIDQAGLKGTRVGGAEISPKHANYIVNLGDASSDDVLRLIDLARTSVLQQTGIELDLEIQVL